MMAIVSCSEEDIKTNEPQEQALNIDDFEFSLRTELQRISKDDPKALEKAISDLIDDAGELLKDDRSIEEVVIPILEDEHSYIVMPHTAKPAGSPLVGKCLPGIAQIHSCNGLSSDCKKEVEALIKESFTGLGTGSEVTVNINVSQLGQVRVCRGGEK